MFFFFSKPEMAAQSKLFSESGQIRLEIDGSPDQVFSPLAGYLKFLVDGVEAGRFASLASVDGNTEWINVVPPQVHHDADGNPLEIVGN